jgi:hypothetical protein
MILNRDRTVQTGLVNRSSALICADLPLMVFNAPSKSGISNFGVPSLGAQPCLRHFR